MYWIKSGKENTSGHWPLWPDEKTNDHAEPTNVKR